MVAALVLSLREGLEAALIIGIVLGALKRLQRMDLSPALWRGAGAAAAASLLIALVMGTVGAEMEGHAEEIFEGAAMFLACGVLTWMIFWMRSQAGTIKQKLESSVSQAASGNGQRGLFTLAFLSVGKEGFELALFLIATRFSSDGWQTLAGALAGLAAAAVLGWMLFATTRRLSLKAFFGVTNVLLIVFAAGLAAHGVHEFNEAGLIPAVIEPLWDTSRLLSDSSLVGEIFKALLGYDSNPSLTEVGAYLVYYLVIGLALYTGMRRTVRSQAGIQGN